MTTAVWDGKTLAADCLTTVTSATNIEHRRAYSNKIYLFSDIIWRDDELLLAAAYAGTRIFIDKMLVAIRTRKNQPETLCFVNELIKYQLGPCKISQLYITDKAVYFKESTADSDSVLQRIAHAVYDKEPKKRN